MRRSPLAAAIMLCLLLCLFGETTTTTMASAQQTMLFISEPLSLRSMIPLSPAWFGLPGSTIRPSQGPLVLTQPPRGICDLHSVQNCHQLKGAIVFTERGDCSFVTKGLVLQQCGAKALVIVNREPLGPDHPVIQLIDDGNGKYVRRLSVGIVNSWDVEGLLEILFSRRDDVVVLGSVGIEYEPTIQF